MGRRKNNKNEKKNPPKKVMQKFDCEECGNKASISIEIRKDKGRRLAKLFCRVCKIQNEDPIEAKVLDEPIDIYVKWISERRGEIKKEVKKNDSSDESHNEE